MKNIGVTIFIVLLIAVMVLYLISFQVRETQLVLVTTFGKPTGEITKPGWYFKWPSPIQRVYRFDSRMQVFEGNVVETTTRGAVPIIVNTYVVWKIAEPLQFFKANDRGSIREAKSKLRSQINDTQNKVVGRHFFGEFVNSDPSKIKFKQIEEEMLHNLRSAIRDEYGIEIKTLGIKQLKISKEVSKDVFDRMRADRQRKTLATIAEGNSEATKIRTDADAKKTELLAAAKARAKAIRGQGDAEAAKYYKMLAVEPEFAMFLRNIEAFKRISDANSTFVIPSDMEPFELLKKRPNLRPKEPNEPKE